MLPSIAVAGAGPAGLMVALLLSRQGLSVDVFEEAPPLSPAWTPRSYSININARGQNALKAAGVLDNVKRVSTPRRALMVHRHDSTLTVPKTAKTSEELDGDLAISRQALCKALQETLLAEDTARIHPGVRIQGLRLTHTDKGMREGDGGQQLLLEAQSADATQKNVFSEMVFSHVIAADGKWSVVRAAAAALEQERQGQKISAGVGGGGDKTLLSWTTHHEQTWGVQISLPEMPENGEGWALAEGWRRDASHIFYPKTLQGAIYALVMPLQDAGTQQKHTSISLVCSDLLLDTYPWAGPLDSRERESWQAAAASPDIDENFQKLVEAEFPHLLLPATCSPRFSVGKRSSWVEVDSFVACDSRVAFVGDAAHSMVPSLGEGCNTALESAVALAHHVASAASGSCSVSSADLSAGLQHYSAVRLPEAQEVQRKSALAARGMTNTALADLQKKSTKGDPS